MHGFTETIHIDRPRDAVWPYLIELPKIKQWVNFETMEQVTEGPVEKGTRWHQTFRFLGKQVEVTDELIEFEAGHRLVMRPIESPISYVLEQRVEEDEDGTTVVCDFEVADTGGFFGKIAEPVVVRLFEREIRAQLERLKALAEADVD